MIPEVALDDCLQHSGLAAVASPVVASGALVVYGMSTSTGMVAYQSTLQTAEIRTDLRDRAPAGITSGTANVTTEPDL